ncbi:MAG TPA: AAA family ATPase, partial [Planctomycetaceae bacterium]|nr:AAA family ATPase [Planctomycetaceae bacterium]
MITLIEALNYRCLRYVSQPLERFHVLVGPNASGKTTFLDVIAFLGDLVNEGIEAAITKRSPNYDDLTFGRTGRGIQLAIEAKIPSEFLDKVIGERRFHYIRYEIALQKDEETHEVMLQSEILRFLEESSYSQTQRTLFPKSSAVPDSILLTSEKRDSRAIITKGDKDSFWDETGKEAWLHKYKLGPRRSALANLPEDESSFPVATWIKELLTEG